MLDTLKTFRFSPELICNRNLIRIKQPPPKTTHKKNIILYNANQGARDLIEISLYKNQRSRLEEQKNALSSPINEYKQKCYEEKDESSYLTTTSVNKSLVIEDILHFFANFCEPFGYRPLAEMALHVLSNKILLTADSNLIESMMAENSKKKLHPSESIKAISLRMFPLRDLVFFFNAALDFLDHKNVPFKNINIDSSAVLKKNQSGHDRLQHFSKMTMDGISDRKKAVIKKLFLLSDSGHRAHHNHLKNGQDKLSREIHHKSKSDKENREKLSKLNSKVPKYRSSRIHTHTNKKKENLTSESPSRSKFLNHSNRVKMPLTGNHTSIWFVSNSRDRQRFVKKCSKNYAMKISTIQSLELFDVKVNPKDLIVLDERSFADFESFYVFLHNFRIKNILNPIFIIEDVCSYERAMQLSHFNITKYISPDFNSITNLFLSFKYHFTNSVNPSKIAILMDNKEHAIQLQNFLSINLFDSNLLAKPLSKSDLLSLRSAQIILTDEQVGLNQDKIRFFIHQAENKPLSLFSISALNSSTLKSSKINSSRRNSSEFIPSRMNASGINSTKISPENLKIYKRICVSMARLRSENSEKYSIHDNSIRKEYSTQEVSAESSVRFLHNLENLTLIVHPLSVHPPRIMSPLENSPDEFSIQQTQYLNNPGNERSYDSCRLKIHYVSKFNTVGILHQINHLLWVNGLTSLQRTNRVSQVLGEEYQPISLLPHKSDSLTANTSSPGARISPTVSVPRGSAGLSSSRIKIIQDPPAQNRQHQSNLEKGTPSTHIFSLARNDKRKTSQDLWHLKIKPTSKQTKIQNLEQSHDELENKFEKLENIHSQCQFRILHVEDHEANHFLAKKILNRLGHEVSHASNGFEAIRLVEEVHFDVILMDCYMPGMDGFEAAKFIRKIELKTKRYTPIIALTADDTEDTRLACKDAGMDDFITKPFKIFEVEAAIKSNIQFAKSRKKSVGDHDKFHREHAFASHRVNPANARSFNDEIGQKSLSRDKNTDKNRENIPINLRNQRSFNSLNEIEISPFNKNTNTRLSESQLMTGGFDSDHFEKLVIALGAFQNPEIVETLIGMFENQFPPLLECLSKAITAVDYSNIRQISHRLKGSSLNLGASELAILLGEIESGGKAKEKIDYSQLLEKVRVEFSEALSCLKIAALRFKRAV